MYGHHSQDSSRVIHAPREHLQYRYHLRSSLTIVTYDRKNIFIVQAIGRYKNSFNVVVVVVVVVVVDVCRR